MDFDAFLRSFRQSKNDSFAFLLGAGASISSGIQSAGDCIWDWKKQIYMTNNPNMADFLDIHSEICRRKIQKWLDNQGGYPMENSEEEYVFYAEKTFTFATDRTKYFKDLCYDKSPSIGYKLLCLLHTYGVVKSIWTTNFDGLTERAAHQSNISPKCVTLDNSDDIYRPENSNELLCVALHGDYKYTTLKNTAKELDAQQEQFSQILKEYFRNRNLVVIGYSGRDKSLMSTLEGAFNQPGGGRLYWCGYGSTIPDGVKTLIKTAQRSGRDAAYISTDGFDKTLISLMFSTYSDNKERMLEIRKLLADVDTLPAKTSFLDQKLVFGGCIKSNLYPVIIPSDMFGFEIQCSEERSLWHIVKERINGTNILAEPFKGKVYAFGLARDINQTFRDIINGDIERTPISIQKIKENSMFRSLIKKTITCGLSSACNLKASVSKSLIWNPEWSIDKKMNIYEAVKIQIACLEKNKYILIALTPTLYFKNEALSSDIRKKTIANYLDKIRNMEFERTLSKWEQRIFNGRPRMFDYPIGSNNNFKFSIGNNRGLVSVDYSDRGLIPEKTFNDRKIIYNGLMVSEPNLCFWDKKIQKRTFDSNPMRGMVNNSPYDYEFHERFQTGIQLGVICPVSHGTKLETFLNGLNCEVNDGTKLQQDYIQPYVGFEKTYSTILNIPASNSELWVRCKDEQKDSVILAQNICKHAYNISINHPGVVVVIYIPKSWEKHRSFYKDGEIFDLHSYIKAYAAQHGFATQFIEEKTLLDSRMKSQIYWWLSLALFVKAMRTPWTLSDLDADTAYAGIGYSLKSNSKGTTKVVVGCSHIYNSNGQGLRYKLSQINNPLFDSKKNPYLSYEEAYKFAINIQELFVKSMDNLPTRVVIHKRTPFKEEEIKGITDALKKSGIKKVDLVTITIEDSIRCTDQYLQNGMPYPSNFPVRRGVCVAISDFECLLWTHGVVDSIRPSRSYYAGGRGIPAPLKITKYYGEGTMPQLAKEILGFTKMNWNTFNFYTKYPATIDTSNTLAKVGNLLSHYNGATYDYRYFI